MIRRFLMPVVATAAALSLGACALLSTPDPVQTYRFGAAASLPDAASPAPSPDLLAVSLRRIVLPEASRGDRILGVTGTEVAYIKGARWISPAETLMDDGLRAAFSARQDRVRLLGGRDLARADRALGLEITTFEARYSAPGTAPQIIITAHARLTTLPDRSQVQDKVFTVVQPASANRLSAIVEAFDIAVRDLNTQVVDWTGATPRT